MRSLNPLYGKKGVGWLRNPKKALYNKVYNKTSIGLFAAIRKLFRRYVLRPLLVRGADQSPS